MSVRISAVICTYNRADYLRKSVKSICEQSLPKDEYEIIIVDNASTDNTSKVAEEFTGLSNLRYIYEEEIGLAHARNKGWRSAHGEYVAYLDDDAIASSRWLANILEVFDTVRPKPGCVGGKVMPIWEAERPSWLSDSKLGELTIVNWSDTPLILNRQQWLAGANMAFPKVLLEETGGFHPHFGRKGNRLSTGEEIFLLRQIRRKGLSCFYHPEISVHHHIPASRLTKRWFLKRAFWQGVSDTYMGILEESPRYYVRFRKGLSTLLRILLSPQEIFSLAVPTNSPERFSLKCSVVARVGSILCLWKIVR